MRKTDYLLFRLLLRRVAEQRFFAVGAHELLSEYVGRRRPGQRKRAVQAEHGHYLVADDSLVAVVHVLELPCKISPVRMFLLYELRAYGILHDEYGRDKVLYSHRINPGSGCIL